MLKKSVMPLIEYKTGNHTSRVIVGRPWQEVRQMIDTSKTIIITDENVSRIYGSGFPSCPVIVVEPGEGSKSLRSAGRLLSRLLEMGAGRSTFILGIGGGVVCDLAGFVASVFMRGIGFGFVSTSLLSQVDASLGGKNGINLDGIKNVVGTFNQPEFVLCDTNMLKTLPEEEYLSGMAEVVKHALIKDAGLMGYLEESMGALKERDPGILETIVAGSVNIKRTVVEADEKEKGERRLLNFGHTIGHAIESVTSIRHGFAISYGMVLASEFSVEEGLLDSSEAERIINTLGRMSLLPALKIDPGILQPAILKDKKMDGDEIFFVFLESIGKGIVRRVPVARVTAFLKSRSD